MPGWELPSPPFTAPPGDALLGLPRRRALGTLPCFCSGVSPSWQRYLCPSLQLHQGSAGGSLDVYHGSVQGMGTCTMTRCRAQGHVSQPHRGSPGARQRPATAQPSPGLWGSDLGWLLGAHPHAPSLPSSAGPGQKIW